ncbi:PIN domain-containing protein [Candidatus Poribacteria bacterium]|nr:PIN domain-containing protein [Candidatus Poribacteria bacterium]
MRIYLDCCCLNRPFDDLRQERVRIESDAVTAILGKIERGEWQMLASDFLLAEVGRIPEPMRRKSCLAFVARASEFVPLGPEVESELRRLVSLGIPKMDAAHMASAVIGKADVFLTVDVVLLRRAHRLGEDFAMPVQSPVTWLFKIA